MSAQLSALRHYWKLHVVGVLIVGIVFGEVLLAYLTTSSNQAADTAVNGAQSLITLTNEAQAALIDMETGYRGYLLTGQETYLEPFVQGRDVYQSRLRELEQKTRSPAQLARFQSIEQQAADWQRDITDPTIAHRQELGTDPAALAEVATMVASANGKGRMDQMRSLFAETITTEQAALAVRLDEQAVSDGRLLNVLVWGTALAAGLSLVLCIWVFWYLEHERLAGVRLAIQTTEHELFNQLAGASCNVQLLQREADLSSAQRRWADRASASINRSVDTIRAMRDLPQLRETYWGLAMVRTIRLRS